MASLIISDTFGQVRTPHSDTPSGHSDRFGHPSLEGVQLSEPQPWLGRKEINHRLSASGGGVAESSTVASRQNRLHPHAEIFSCRLNNGDQSHAARWITNRSWTSERFEDTRRHGAEQEAVAVSAGSHAERGDRHGASRPCRNRSRALRAPEGVKINSCARKSGWTIGFNELRAQVSEVPPGARSANPYRGICETDPGPNFSRPRN